MNTSLQKNVHTREIHIRDYVQVILRRKWIVVVSFIIVLTTTAFHSFKASPIYQATAQLEIRKENPYVVSLEEVMSVTATDSLFHQTQYKVLSSRSLALRVINSMNLKDSREFKPHEVSIWDMFKKPQPEEEPDSSDKNIGKKI